MMVMTTKSIVAILLFYEKSVTHKHIVGPSLYLTEFIVSHAAWYWVFLHLLKGWNMMKIFLGEVCGWCSWFDPECRQQKTIQLGIEVCSQSYSSFAPFKDNMFYLPVWLEDFLFPYFFKCLQYMFKNSSISYKIAWYFMSSF